MRSLPGDWKSLRLEEICGFYRGLTYKKKDEVDFSTNAVLRANNVSLESGELDLTEIRYIDDQIQIPAAKKVRMGSLLVCMASGSKKHLGKVALIDEDYGYAFGGFMGLLLPNAIVDSKYLYWITQSKDYSDYIMGLSDGANINNLKFSQLGQYQVSLPPIAEQKRIVAILDEAFAGIATAVANTEKNLANARELFESYLNAVVSRGGEGWRRTKLGLEIDLQTGFAFKSKGYTKDVDGIRLLRGDNIIPGGIRWQDHKKWARDDADAYSKYQLAAGDVVLAMDRTWIKSGLKYAQLNDVDLPCLLVQRVARLRAGPRLNSDFLRCLIGSASFTNYVLSIQTGLGVPHISGPQISEFEFFMPPVDEQAAIALSLDDLGSSVGRLEANYETKYAALCELKQSLLQKAFSGELTATPQDEIETALA